MAINRFSDYDEVKAYSDGPRLPKGGYVIRIKRVDVKDNEVGQYLEMQYDIVEGEFRNFFKNNYEEKLKNDSDAKWAGICFVNVPRDDGTEKDGWTKRSFKTFTEALEASNEGFHFNWNEDELVGLLVGGLFREEEYEYTSTDGERKVGKSTKLGGYTSVEKVREGKYRLPKDRLLSTNGSSSGDYMDFMSIPGGVSEVPFE